MAGMTIANFLYILGSLCFLLGTLANVWKLP